MTQKKKSAKRPIGIKKTADIKKPEEFKRSLKDFLADEEGFVKKETILKIGLATVSGIGMLGALTEFTNAYTHASHASHGNGYAQALDNTTQCPTFDPTHHNLSTHASHSSY